MTSSALLDSGVIIGCFVKDDQYKKQSKAILESIAKGDIRRVYLTDAVFIETINFMARKTNHEEAIKTADLLLTTDKIRIVYLDRSSVAEVRRIFERYPGLSWTDCSLVYLAMKLGVKRIYSFDRLFDRVKGIERLESVD